MITTSYLDIFYKTERGQQTLDSVVQIIQRNIEPSDKNMLCIGYGGDFLQLLNNERLFYAIPYRWQATRWPQIRPFKTAVIDETRMPFRPNTWDAILLIHHIEHSQNTKKLLQEIYRVLKNYGKLIIVFMNQITPYYSKHSNKIKSKHVINAISKSQFSITNIDGINKNLKIWPYSFSYSINRHNEYLLQFLPILSDIIVISAEKKEHSLEPKFNILLKEQYGSL